MAKISGKNAIILFNGYAMSPLASAYTVEQSVMPVDVTGFTDGSKNFAPGIASASVSVDMMWDSDAAKTHAVLKTAQTIGIITLLPEGYALGAPSLSLPYLQSTYSPKSAPDARIDVGSIMCNSYGGTNVGIENGIALQHGTTTTTLTGTGFDDPTGAAVTAACAASLHIWSLCAADTYVIKVQHSTALGTGYADLVTFTLNGSALGAERIAVASGTINRYRRVLATRTGSAGNTLGFSVHFWHA